MGHVEKYINPANIRIDTFIRVRDKKKIAELRAKGLIEDREGIGIIIYSETDFAGFVDKHALRNEQAGTYTVVVKNLTSKPEPIEIRILVEEALREGKREDDIVIPLPQPYARIHFSVRTWNADINKLVSDPQTSGFRFRDILDINSYEMLEKYVLPEVGEREYNEILSRWQASRQVGCREWIDYIWFVRKIMIFDPGYKA